jgi:sugar lactone lactonase YvrE
MQGIRVSLRGLAALAAVCACACLVTASASAAPLLWSLNYSTGSVSTIDTGTGQVAGSPIPTGARPDSIAITPNGTRAVVTNYWGESVTVIDTATRMPVATIPLPAQGERVAITPDGKTAWVTVEGGEKVYLIAPESNANATIGSFTVGKGPLPVAFSPDGKYAYVGLEEGVQVVDAATGASVGKPIAIGSGVADWIVLTPDGKTAYVSEGEEVAVLDTALGIVTGHIPIGSEAEGLAVTPDGRRLYVAGKAGTVTVVETATNQPLLPPLNVGGEPQEIAISPDGRTAYAGSYEPSRITPIATAANRPGTPIPLPGAGAGRLVIAPDQSPTAVFTAPPMSAGSASTFDGSASTDTDGTIAAWSWSFAGGGFGAGVGPIVTHGYGAPGAYAATLSVVDDEGCGAAQVFTGRTAYCSGGDSSVTHPLAVLPAPSTGSECPVKFAIGGVSHNRRNGTARVRLRFFSTGRFVLFGKKLHVVTRKVRAPGSTVVVLHARVELNKRLKRTLHARVPFRVTFTPTAACGSKTRHRSVALLRSKAHRHRDHHRRP